MLPERLTWIDETNRSDHVFLQEGDRCLFFGEYYSGKGYQGGGTNQLILNFKCKPSVAAATPNGRGYYKEQAVNKIASGLRRAITQQNAEQVTWVPIPPSKAVDHAEYDDRLLKSLNRAFAGYNADIRLLLRQVASTEADHAAFDRIAPDELHAIIQLDEAAINSRPVRQTVILFDDVLTTGKHFKCCERRLREVVPLETPIVGIFVARRILPNPFEVLSS